MGFNSGFKGLNRDRKYANLRKSAQKPDGSSASQDIPFLLGNCKVYCPLRPEFTSDFYLEPVKSNSYS